MPRDPDTVSFRLPPALFSQLTKEAEARGISLHIYARQIVTEKLGSTFEDDQRQEFEATRKGLKTIQEELATATAAMLAFAGKWSPDEARTWVKETLLADWP